MAVLLSTFAVKYLYEELVLRCVLGSSTTSHTSTVENVPLTSGDRFFRFGDGLAVQPVAVVVPSSDRRNCNDVVKSLKELAESSYDEPNSFPAVSYKYVYL